MPPDSDSQRRRNLLYAILGGIALATIPCYCTAIILIGSYPTPGPAATDTLTPSATITLRYTPQNTIAGEPSATPTITPTNTLYFPPTGTVTSTPTNTPVPTSTPVTPTDTPLPTATPPPSTDTPTDVPTS